MPNRFTMGAGLRALAREYGETVAPLALREMRSLMRGRRGPLALLCCTGGVAAIELIALGLLYRTLGSAYPVEALAVIGRRLFFLLTMLETVLVLLIVPLLTAGSISGEYRRGTMESLLLTRLTGRDIVCGKLLSSLGFFAVLLLCLLPVVSIITLLGGVSPWEVLLTHLLLLATAYSAGAFALLCSACFHHGATSYIAAYLVIGGALTVLFPFTMAIPALIFWVRNPGERNGCLFFLLGLLTWIPFLFVALPLALLLMFSASPTFAFLCLFIGNWSLHGFWWAAALLSAGFQLLLGRGFLGIAAERVRPPYLGLTYFKGTFTRRKNINWEE